MKLFNTGEISLNIPWTNLYSAPCDISIEDVFLIAGPVKEQPYDGEKARASEVAYQRKSLRQIEQGAAKKTDGGATEKTEDEGGDSFFEKLIAQVLKNLKVSVKNVHVRYEDKVTSTESPFSVGFTLQNLSAETTDDGWKTCVVEADVKTVYKLVSLDNLTVYWNTGRTVNDLYTNHWNWKVRMEDGISTKSRTATHYEFILQPLSAECHVIMDQSSDIEMDTPKLLVEVIQQELLLSLSQKQFHNLMDVIDSFELMAINQKYKKYQPIEPINNNAKIWWKYAYTAICEDKIRCWSWERIKLHRSKYKAYKELYKSKLKGLYESERESVLLHLQALEDDLDIPSVLIARQQAEIEVPPDKRETSNMTSKSSSSPWWMWLGVGAGGSPESGVRSVREMEEEEGLLSKLTVAGLPPEEKEKLYKAIDYSESAAPIKYPPEYIKRRLTFHLDSCLVMLSDEKKRKIAEISTEGFAATLEQRPGGDAIRFQAEVNGFQVLGTPGVDTDERPCLMSSKTSLGSEGKALLCFSCEINPLDVEADYSVKLKVEPMEIKYDNITVDKVVDFFDVPNYSKLQELEAAAANKLKELRSWTRAGLEYAIVQHKVTYVDMDVRSPYIVIPEHGNLEREGSVLIIDLGHLTVVSDLVKRGSIIRKASDDELAELFYDKFNINITDVEVILADKDSDWQAVHKLETSPDHILPSTELELQAFKSISAEYPELPEFKLISVLPKLWIKLSDTKYKQLMQFLNNFPLGGQKDMGALKDKALQSTVDKEWTRTTSTLSLDEATSIQTICREAFKLKTNNKEGEDDVWFDSVEYLPSGRSGSKTSQTTDRTQFAGEFAIHQLLVTIDKADSLSDKPYISLEVKNLSTVVTINTWDMSAKTTLGFIEMLDNNFQGVDGSALRMLSSSAKNDWISVNYIKADPAGPEFSTKFDNIEQLVKIKFSSIELIAQKEALASFEMFIIDLLQSDADEPYVPVVRRNVAALEIIQEDEQLDIRPIEPVRRGVVDMSIEAEMEEVCVTLVAKEHQVGNVNITGLNVIIDKRGSETKINTKLQDFSVTNSMEGTFYPKILSLEDNTLFDCEVTLFDNKTGIDPLALDVVIDLKIGRFKFVYLSGFTRHIQNFVQALVSPETMSYAQNITRNALKTRAQNIQQQGTKLGLNISVHAPKLVIPGHSQSRDMLVADLGNLEIKNAIERTRDGGVLMDNMVVSLSSFEVRCVSEQESVFNYHLVEPIKLDVFVKRRLDALHTHLPLVEVDAVLELFQVNLAVPDYKLLMMVLNKNLNEGQEETDAPASVSPSYGSVSVDEERMREWRQRVGSVLNPRDEEEDTVWSADDEVTLKCNFQVHKVIVNSPRIVENKAWPYLILSVEKLVSTMTFDAWTINVHADLGTMELLDHVNEDLGGQPVSIVSSSKEADLISVDYRTVDPTCPDFETTHCSVQQTANIEFRKLMINCPQKAAMDLQEHILALLSSDEEPQSLPTETTELAPPSPGGPSRNPLSFKLNAKLWEVVVVLSTAEKDLATIEVKGLAADVSIWEGGLVVKSTQRDLSITDLDPSTFYPKIISVENEKVFEFEFKYLTTLERVGSSASVTDSTEMKPDAILDLNIGRINVVFLYRFIDDLMRYVEPLTSPRSTKYVQETATKTVYDQFESLQSQGTRIALDVSITAPLVVMPRHSNSVDMLIADLGHLELQNEFQVFEMDVSKEQVVLDIMELTLQSVQLARGRMDLSNSSVVKRYLIEPIKLDAVIKRSLKPSCHEIPFLESTATLDFIKMNLGAKDYQLLTTITQENLGEAQTLTGENIIVPDNKVVEETIVQSDQRPQSPLESITSDTETSSLRTSSSEDVWDYMVFLFDLPGISLKLYTNEKDLDPFDSQSALYDSGTSLCRCDVEKTSLNLALPSDGSVHLQGLLHGFIIEDTRQERQSAFPRLIDKKLVPYSKAVTSSQEMCEVFYCQKANGDMEVVLQLQNATIFVNFPFIWPLLEFFTVTPTQETDDDDHFLTPAASQTSFDAPIPEDSMSRPSNISEDVSDRTDSRRFNLPVPKVPSAPLPDFNLTVRATVKQSDIVLLANPMSKDSEALVVQTEMELAYTMANEKQNLNALLSSLQMISCQFPQVKDAAYKVLSPCDVNFQYKTPGSEGRGQEINIDLDQMTFQFSPVLLKTVTDVIGTLSGQEKVTEGIQTDGMERIPPPADLWCPKPTSAEHWLRRIGEKATTAVVSRKSTGDKITLTTKEVDIVLVNEVQSAHVPLLLIKSFVKASAIDYTAQMKLEADIAIEISFYNERLGAWEPLLEPVSEDKDSSFWELQIKVFVADSYVSSFTPRDQESNDGPPQDVTDAPTAHRWIPWQNRPRSEVKRERRRKSSFKGRFRQGTFRRTGRRKALRQMTSDDDDEDELDYLGAMDHFILNSTRVFSDPSSVDEVIEDIVDGYDVTDDVMTEEDKPQATYLVLNSHDVMQLTVTPTALDVLSELSRVWTEEREAKIRSIPGPTFAIKNELGIHALVVVSHKQKILEKEDELLTVRYRTYQDLERKCSLSDTLAAMATSLLAEQKKMKKRRRIFSEPLLNHFREKFQKIHRRRASSLPVHLERGFERRKKPIFEVGGRSPRKGRLKKSSSLDASDSQRGHSPHDVNSSSDDDEDMSSWKHRVRKRKNDLFALDKHEEVSEVEETDSTPQPPDMASSSGVDEEDVGNRVAFSIANVGTMVGGISSPQFSDTELETNKREHKEAEDETPQAADAENFISVVVDGYHSVDFVPIMRSGRYLYKLRPKVINEGNVKNHVVVQVDIKNGQKTVIIRSPLQVYNHLDIEVDLLVLDEETATEEQRYETVLIMDGNSCSNVPLTLAHDNDLYVRPHDPRFSVCPKAISWRALSKDGPGCILVASQITVSDSLGSLESLESLESVQKELHIKVFCQADSLNKTPGSDVPHHVMHLYPPIILHNLLPVDVVLLPKGDDDREEVILPGEQVPIMSGSLENTCQLTIKLKNLIEVDWVGTLDINRETGKTAQLIVTSQDNSNQLTFGVLIMQNGTTDVTIYSPYWLINKTGLPVEYRISKTHFVYYQRAVDDQPLLFNFTGKRFRKARLRVCDSLWSKKFSLDAVGDSGLVHCKDVRKTRKFEFVLQIEMSQTGLTKIVTLTPKYVVINTTEISISYCEDGVKAPFWFAIEPDECKPFWPHGHYKRIFIKPTMSPFISKAVPFGFSHTTVLRMRDLVALGVEVHGEVQDSVTTILITPYSPGVGTIRIENLCEDIAIRFNQEDVGQAVVLSPQLSMLYTWDDPTELRRLLWKPYLGVDDAVIAPVYKDDHGELNIEIDESGPDIKDDRKAMEDSQLGCVNACFPSSPAGPASSDEGADQVDGVARLLRHGNKRSKKTIYWVSMLDGLQRVLLFTENSHLASMARMCSEREPVTMELFVSLDGIGLSLVNNKPEEVSHITLSSSTSVWQVQKSPGRWKTLNIELSSWLEDSWKNGEQHINMDETAVVDFSRMTMVQPYEGALRRSFEPALWLHYCSSEHYQSVHCKMHRIQIDNQLYGTVFPVVLYPAPLPPGVAIRHGPKPFIEVSIIYHDVPAQGVYHFKYAKALVQEINVKLDKCFIIAITSLLSKQPEAVDEETNFKLDLNSVKVQLKETMAVKDALQTQRVFLEYFHLSPLKINLSFSLISDPEDDPDQAFASHIMDFFIDSIGATLTDMNDAQLKLAFFERVGVFITQDNLQGQITRHYTMQGVRQIYALVLGLDVLGNPYALISGIGEGVKDLFYEPYQGIIYGPQEFAEGLARGVKSLLGHVVGGTAGAFSRITGSIGQAVATLTFDTDYRMKRRMRMHVEPKGIGQGLMMGGKSLVMGLVFGIGGVVMKPIEGARSEGVEGFFKGIGKGFLGLLTRPTGGIIDMVSFTLDGIRRSAEQGGEDIAYRMRLPRFVAPDEPLVPFSEEQAKGYGILKSLHSPELSSDVYVSDMTVSEENNSGFVILTNKRIIMLHQTRFWKEWKVDWMCLYDDVTSEPFISSDTLVIKRKESESTIDVMTHVYEIESNSREDLKKLKSEISNALRRYR